MICTFKRLGWLVGWGLLSFPDTHAAPPPTARRVVIPLYAAGIAAPVGVVRIDEIRNEFQRRGFFRIGALPLWVAQGVRVELTIPVQIDRVLQAMTLWHPPAGRQIPVEWREVHFGVQGSPTSLLEVGTLRAGKDGTLLLSDGVTLRGEPPTPDRRWPSATWSASGGAAGSLSLPDGSRLPLSLPPTPSSPPTPHPIPSRTSS